MALGAELASRDAFPIQVQRFRGHGVAWSFAADRLSKTIARKVVAEVRFGWAWLDKREVGMSRRLSRSRDARIRIVDTAPKRANFRAAMSEWGIGGCYTEIA